MIWVCWPKTLRCQHVQNSRLLIGRTPLSLTLLVSSEWRRDETDVWLFFLLWYASMLLNYLSKLVLRMSGGPTGGPWVSCRGSPAKVQQNIWLKVGMWTKVLIGCNLQESWRLFCSFKPKKTIIYICCNGPSWRKVWEDTRCIRLYSYQPGQVELGKDYRQFRQEESVQ